MAKEIKTIKALRKNLYIQDCKSNGFC